MKTLQVMGNGEQRGIGILLKVNNNGVIEVEQKEDDGMLEVRMVTKGRYKEPNIVENSYNISAGDFVTMLNWFRYQKDNGNINLDFE